MTGTIHGLDGVIAVFRTGSEHVLVELVPVAGFFPQAAVQHQRSVDLLVAFPRQFGADIIPDDVIQRPALRMPEHQPRRLFLEMEQVLLAAQLAVVAFLRLFQPLQVLLQRLPVRPRRAVDALQHLVTGVPAPVGPGQPGQFERAEFAGAGNVGPAAEIDKFALPVQR